MTQDERREYLIQYLLKEEMKIRLHSRRRIFLPFLVRIPSFSRFFNSLVMALLSTVRY